MTCAEKGILQKAPFLSFCYEFYHQYDEFRKDYKTKFGKDPATEPTVKQRWFVEFANMAIISFVC